MMEIFPFTFSPTRKERQVASETVCTSFSRSTRSKYTVKRALFLSSAQPARGSACASAGIKANITRAGIARM